MPPPEELPELVELPEEDSRAAYARNTAVMTVGTTLSRITGFLRIAAQTAALGVLVGSLGDTYTRANTTPNIVYELILGGILTSIFVPVFVEWRNKYGREAAWDVGRRVLTLTLVVLSVVTVLGMIFAPQIMRLYLVFSDAADRESQIELGAYLLRWFMPQIVFYGIGAVASGLLNSERRFAAPMFAPVLNNLVAIATFIGYAMLRRLGDPLGRPDHHDGEAGAGRRHHARRGGDDRGVVALAAFDRVPLEAHRRLEPPGGPAPGQALALGHRVRVREPDRLPGHQHPGRRHRGGPLPDLRHRVHRLLVAPRDLRRLDLHRLAARHVPAVDRRQARRRGRPVVPGHPGHRRRDRAGRVRLRRDRRADRPAAAPIRRSGPAGHGS